MLIVQLFANYAYQNGTEQNAQLFVKDPRRLSSFTNGVMSYKYLSFLVCSASALFHAWHLFIWASIVAEFAVVAISVVPATLFATFLGC